MGRKASTITLSEEDRKSLETKIRARTSQAQIVQRARMLLLKADGKTTNGFQNDVVVS